MRHAEEIKNKGAFNMNELYINLGFNENPFSRYSAEEELDYLDKIYNTPKYYTSIYSDIKKGLSRFVIGERGIGKSALMFKLMKDLGDYRSFAVIIDQFDEIPLIDNGKELLVLIIRKLITMFSVTLLKNKDAINGLSKEEKEKLAFFINTFFESLSKTEFDELYNKAAKIKTKNFLKKIFNTFCLKPINIGISGVSDYISTTISKSLGLNYEISEEFYKAYVPELKLNKRGDKLDVLTLDYASIKGLLNELVGIIAKCNFQNVVIFFDKIDEYQSLGTNINNIAEFIRVLATDTSLLHMQNCSLVFVIWSKVKSKLNSLGVRFDKFKPVDVTWTDKELKAIIDDRLKYFSNQKIDLKRLLPDISCLDRLIKLAYKSPRHLIMLLSRIYDEQEMINSGSSLFSTEAIEKGILTFSKSFDFPTLYPGVASRKDYIVKVVNRLLRIGKLEFETKDIISVFKISSGSSNNDIKTMRGYGLIEEIASSGSPSKKYVVVEPRIKFLIEKNILSLDMPE
jgi:hypothetical protein